MILAPGAWLNSFEIISPMGAGGMGEVYRARDSKLKREVAVKILPDAFARDPGRIARFEREAELLAALNHAAIATVHDFQQSGDRHFLVMELVEGETLAERLKRGVLGVDESLHVARQLAEALEAAHQKGIVHRDLKPANIKIAPDGKVKVLDFGLAKIFEDAVPSCDLANSPTSTSPATAAGVLLGTAAYMSPEQARGGLVDNRTDIWALGCVLYEMLTGTPAFATANLSETIAAVLRGDPDWGRLPDDTPPRVRILLRRCLQKDPRERLHDAADVRIELADADSDAAREPSRTRSSRVQRLAPVAIALVAGAALASAIWWLRAAVWSDRSMPSYLSVTSIARNSSALYLTANHQLVISPDGRNIVYVANRAGHRQLFLRSMGEPDARPIDGTDDAMTAFFSRDGQWIAFGTRRELQKVAISGGSPVTICTLSSTGFYGGDWGADDTIVFVPDYNGGLWTVSSKGGTPRPLLKTDPEHDRVVYSDPELLPDGKGLLFTLASGRAVAADDQDIAVLRPGTSEPQILIHGGSNARYLPTGQIVYVRSGALLSVDFNLSNLAVSGTPVTVIEGLGRTWSGDADYSVSETGTLIYEPDAGIKAGSVLAMVDLKGQVRPITARGNFGEFSISPDGRSIATRIFAINDDIWVYDVGTGTPVRLTFEPLDEIYPQWTHDGSRIVFGTRIGKIFWKPSDGSGQREELTHGDYPRYPESVSRDGKWMVFVEIHPTRRRDIWMMSLEGARQARPLLATDADEWGAKFSPDGQWLAYVSNETGRDEIFIRPTESAGGRKRLSTDGGAGPLWGRDSRHLFFLKGSQLVEVSMDAQGNPIGRDHEIFTVPAFEDVEYDPATPDYDIMPDGEHFVFGLAPRPLAATHYNVVLNWFDELKRKRLARVR
jgi:eukaryotic-like serine/threonine-protein kinase